MKEFTKETEVVEKLMTGSVEFCIDADHVSIPVSRFEELIHAEAELDIILRAYQANMGYAFEYVLKAVFGPLTPENPGEGSGNA